MSTVTDVTTDPRSSLPHIDALLGTGPGWNWLAPARNTLLYSFSLDGGRSEDIGSIYTGGTTAFNPSQQSAVVQVLARITQITGIQFRQTADGAAADIHFSLADLQGGSTAGFASSSWRYEYDGGNVITRYTADAWVYLDNVEFARSNGNPSVGSSGFEVLLHEVGHALGLKHPFEGTVRLPAADDDTAHTLMSYSHEGGPYSDYAPYDIAALMFLYGGDGLGGVLGDGSPGRWLMGSDTAETLTGGAGNDHLQGKGGPDTLTGGAGLDTAHFGRARADYQVQRAGDGTITVQAQAGSEGRDTLTLVERLAFGDQSLAFDLDGAAGTIARCLGVVFGAPFVANRQYVGIGLSALDNGMTPATLMQAALDIRLGTGFTPGALVDLLYGNLVGSPPGAADRAFWVGALTAGQFTPVSLSLAAADLDLNAQHIDLVGLMAHGLGYG